MSDEVDRNKKQLSGYHFTFTLEPQDFIRAMRLHMQPRLIVRIVFAIIFICPLLISLFAVLTSSVGEFGLYPIFILSGIIGVYFLFRFVLLPVQIRRNFSQNTELHLEQTIQLTDDHIEWHNEMSNSKRPWSSFVRWKEDAANILLYFTDNMMLVIPKRILKTEHIEWIKGQLKENNITSKPAPTRLITGIVVFVLVVLFALIQIWLRTALGR